MRIRVCHLYPDVLNLYGDRGNLLVFHRRAQWRGIELDVDQFLLGDRGDFSSYDFIFMGGGADSRRTLLLKNLEIIAPYIVDAVEKGTVLLAIGLGFQLLGRYIKTEDGDVMVGAGVFDAYTEMDSSRSVGDILLEATADLQEELKKAGNMDITTLIGFENHSGRTYLGEQGKALGRVIKGKGNNGKDRTEGAYYKNAFGTFLHGPVLAKNPHFADLLLVKALSPQEEISLEPLDDSLEILAHNTMKKRLIR
ncbi:MAG TPA: glutamine amidotransferase [Syntrophaceticus sp.]|nr:glutamine amidotransferase [Syntrophaceticus sp.]